MNTTLAALRTRETANNSRLIILSTKANKTEAEYAELQAAQELSDSLYEQIKAAK